MWLWLVEGTGLGCTSRSWAEGHRQAQTRRETISGRWGDNASGEKEGCKPGESGRQEPSPEPRTAEGEVRVS